MQLFIALFTLDGGGPWPLIFHRLECYLSCPSHKRVYFSVSSRTVDTFELCSWIANKSFVTLEFTADMGHYEGYGEKGNLSPVTDSWSMIPERHIYILQALIITTLHFSSISKHFFPMKCHQREDIASKYCKSDHSIYTHILGRQITNDIEPCYF